MSTAFAKPAPSAATQASPAVGLDLNRGRALPAIGTTEAKLQQRKLDALKRGVHRISDAAATPFGIHVIGVGAAGVGVIERLLADSPADLLEPAGSRLTALAVDIENGGLGRLRELAARFDASRCQVDVLSLDLPTREQLEDTQQRYIDFLKLDYPLYHENADSTAWLPPGPVARNAEGSVPRAIAKAIYGRAYHDGGRPMLAQLKRFAASVEATGSDSLVCIVFGLSGGTGSGIALDLARHLSNRLFGRRVLVTGIGIAPHADEVESSAAALHTTLAELDVLCDETKNQGVTLSCGELYRNPFTAGFIVVPSPAGATRFEARKQVDHEVASLLTQRRGANLWEALRLLNWVAAPSTQHSAARTPWGARWLHLMGFGSEQDQAARLDIRARLGLSAVYTPEFIELRTSKGEHDVPARAWAQAMDAALAPELPCQVVGGGAAGSVQFLLPRMARHDLQLSATAQRAYDALPLAQKHACHALLLEQGVLLCEPSTRLKGMAGASLGAGGQWIAVPMHALLGHYA